MVLTELGLFTAFTDRDELELLNADIEVQQMHSFEHEGPFMRCVKGL